MGLRIAFFLMAIGLAPCVFTSQAHAQNATVDDGFEPFADYSEFVEASTEETDINFFRYGRLLSFGVSFGQRVLTGRQRNFIDDSLEFGVFATFYITINFAFQAGYKTSSHDAFYYIEEIDENYEATTRFDNYFVHAKYILNTQNLTKSVARFNPYFIGGISQMYRETNASDQLLVAARDGAASFDFGAGLENLFNNNRNFVGLQFMYHYVSFPNENDPLEFTSGNGTLVDSGLRFKGDLWSINLNVGFNF